MADRSARALSSGLGRDPHQPRSATGQARGVRFV